MTCTAPVDVDTLVAYWSGELPEASEAPLEEHLFGCAHCSRRMEAFVALASGVRASVARGKVGMVVSERFVLAMKDTGLRLREYRLGPGGSVNCTISPDDDAVVSRLRAPLAGITRLDVVSTTGGDQPPVRQADVPFDPEAGEVLVVPPAAWLRSMPAFTMHMRLVAVDAATERTIGDYTFNHSPS